MAAAMSSIPTGSSQPVPSPVWATSLYARRDGRWVNVMYQHTPLARP